MSLSKRVKRFEQGDFSELREFLKDNPTWDVNEAFSGGWTALHNSCYYKGSCEVVSVLLSHPDINVNKKDTRGRTPFGVAHMHGGKEVMKVLLEDSRVDINTPDRDGCSTFWWASYHGEMRAIKLMIASEKDIDLDAEGVLDHKTYTPVKIAKWNKHAEVVSLLSRFSENQSQVRFEVCRELGLSYSFASQLFATTVFLCDDYFILKSDNRSGGERLSGKMRLRRIKPGVSSDTERFFRIIVRLPIELQMMLSFRVYGSSKENIKSRDSESAFRHLVKTFA